MKYRKHIILLSIIILLLLYMSLITIYFKSKKEINNVININTNSQEITVDKIINFINDNKIDYLDSYILNFTNSSKIDNQVKLKYVYYAIKDTANFSYGVSRTRFDSYLKGVFGNSVKYKNEDIILTNKIIKYDYINESYIYNENNFDEDIYYSRYNYILDFKITKNTYSLKVSKYFYKDNKVYSSYGDLISEINDLFLVPNDVINIDEYIKNYVNSNHETLSDNSSIYEYIFNKENGSLVLKEYKKLK